ncbi:MAG: DegT/DnrJ/EryC1/StrS aminotransferase family protein [Treponema sp.]|nr:DegT/DnrJ/EryC1/StrS aminotransferase family protein [Treponema sp.]
MPELIPFARPFLGKEEEDAVLAVLRSGWLTTGNECLEFEREFGEFIKGGGEGPVGSPKGLPLCIAVNSATSGLHLALEASGLGPGDLVLLPSLTFAACAAVIRHLGAEAVFVDVSKGGYLIDPACLERALQKLEKGRAKAVMPVHYGGLPCDMDAIMDIARRHGLKVIEDAAHAFPSIIEGKEDARAFAGTIGDAGVFSFYATKTLSTGEGGMVVTRDGEIAERVRLMRSHGIDRSVWDRYTDTRAPWHYQVLTAGYKYNMPDILCALGRVQLRRAGELLALRRELAGLYDQAFAGDGHFILPPTGPADARHLYPLRLVPESLSISRDDFARKLQEQGIGISVHFIPLHTMPYYRERYSLKDSDFPQTMAAYSQSISLPLWPGMSRDQIERVITVVKNLSCEYNGSH